MRRGLPPGGSAARQARSDHLLLVYLALGPERSINRVCEIANDLGMRLTRTTVARYSTRDRWVERAREYDVRREERTEIVLLDRAIASDVDHADFYRRAREIAFQHLGQLVEGGADLTPIEATRMGDIAIKGERLISGKATEAVAIMTSAMTMLTQRIGPAVGALVQGMREGLDEGLPHDELRRRLEAETAAFARMYDDLVESEFRAYGLTDARDG